MLKSLEISVFSQIVFDRLSVLLRRIYARVDTPAILEMERYFPQSQALRDEIGAIRDEAIALFQSHPNVPKFHEISATQSRISANDGKNWRIVLVKAYGRFVAGNAELAPTLTRYLKANPQITTATISYLDPGKHIPPHRGPFRGILRYHICLFAPDALSDNPPWLRVDADKVPYAEGKDLLWDDTFEHEVLNPGPNPRIAVLLDIKRPVKSWPLKAIYWVTIGAGSIYTLFNQRHMRIDKSKHANRASG